MNLLNYNQFKLNEQIKSEFYITDDSGNRVKPVDFQKIQFLDEKVDMSNEMFKFIAMGTLFKHINLENFHEYDPNVPTLNYFSAALGQKLVSEGKLNPDTLYNKPEFKEISKDKLKFHKFLGNKSYLPKTVYTVPDARTKLTYPIIAKPALGHSGEGITKFNTPADFMDAIKKGEKFDLYCEAIKIAKEFRIVYIKDEVCSLMIREANDEKTKFLQGSTDSMTKQGTDDSINFTYHFLCPEELYKQFKNIEEYNKIVADVKDAIPLEFITIDICEDVNGKLYVIEINSTPGAPANVLSQIYRLIFEDFYKRKMSSSTLPYFTEVEHKMLHITLKDRKFQFTDPFINKYLK